MSMQFFIPTRVLLGPGCIRENAALLATIGTRALVVTGRQSAKINGAQQDLEAALTEAGMRWELFDQVEANPSIRVVRTGAALARKTGADCIIGCGGGSPLDAAKAIALLATNEVDDDVLFNGPYQQNALPIVAVPTTAGSGSEVTPYSILTDDRILSKRNISHTSLFPRLSFLDAAYLEKLPEEVTRNTAVDALSHAMEGCLSRRATPLSNMLAAESMRIIGHCLAPLQGKLQGAAGLAVREQLLLASMLAGMVIAHTGSTALHAMGYSLTYFKNIDHGRANGLLMAEYLRFIAQEHGDKVNLVLGYLGMNTLAQLQEALDALLVPADPITDEEIRQFAAIAVKAKNITNTLTQPTGEELAGIFTRSLHGAFMMHNSLK